MSTRHKGGRRLVLMLAATCLLLAGLAVIGWSATRLTATPRDVPVPDPPGHSAMSSRPDARQSPAPPAELRIPAIGVQTELVRLGVQPDGTMEVPTDASRAGWYVHGPVPGERGPAVIAGHVDSRAGPAIFWRLHELDPGDEVEVRRKDGSVAAFRVDRVRRYPKADFPTRQVFGDIHHAGLRLITCGGSFNEATGHYRDNVVVYATSAAGH